jgi:hypothetical protein
MNMYSVVRNKVSDLYNGMGMNLWVPKECISL